MNLKPHHFHEDPGTLHVGTCPNRSYYIPYGDEKEAENGRSSRVVSLNGTACINPSRTALSLEKHYILARHRKRVRFCCSVKPSQLWW